MWSVSPRTFSIAFFVASALALLVIALRACNVPITHDEASTFFFYVQTDNYQPYKAHAYTNNHVLNSFLATQCYKLWGASPFVLRLPNILSFLVLVFGISRLFRHCRTTGAKLMLVAFFILTFNLLDFFALCRGYGLSLAFMVFGLTYLQDYFKTKRVRDLAVFIVSWQIALAANLALIQPVIVFLFLVLLFQLREKQLLRPAVLVLHAGNIYLLTKWIRFALYYRSLGLLDSGGSSGFYEVTVKPMMDLLFGSSSVVVQCMFVILFLLTLIVPVITMIRNRSFWSPLFNDGVCYVVSFCLLAIMFMLQNKLFGINFPENRTALFFYVLYALSVTFMFDRHLGHVSFTAGSVAVGISAVIFIFSMNLSKFMYPFYHVMPDRFLTYLQMEQKRSPEILTIGGHVNREMNYAFGNYRLGAPLNPMDIPAAMTLNYDYYYALAAEFPLYEKFYHEVFTDDWNRVLLKRRQPLKRIPVFSRASPLSFRSQAPYFDLIKLSSDEFSPPPNLEVEVDLQFKKVPSPFRAFLALEVKNDDGNVVQYKRVVLNWLADDLSGQRRRLKLSSSPVAGGFASLSVYLWNIDQLPVDIVVNSVKILGLEGAGVGLTMPELFYIHDPDEMVDPL